MCNLLLCHFTSPNVACCSYLNPLYPCLQLGLLAFNGCTGFIPQSCRCKDDCSSMYCVCGRSSVKCWYDKVSLHPDKLNCLLFGFRGDGLIFIEILG